MYKTILVPLDGSSRAERILAHVENMALHYDSTVVLLQVVSPIIPMMDPDGFNFPQSRLFEESALLPILIEGTRLNLAFSFGVAALLVGYVFMYRSFVGFQMQVAGYARDAASYAGFSTKRMIWIGLMSGGAMAGLAGIGVLVVFACLDPSGFAQLLRRFAHPDMDLPRPTSVALRVSPGDGVVRRGADRIRSLNFSRRMVPNSKCMTRTVQLHTISRQANTTKTFDLLLPSHTRKRWLCSNL